VSIFTPIVSAEAGLISFLMNNGFILGEGKAATSGDISSIKDIGAFLNYIWRIIRDLVNYAFIVVLLVIAFMTVITAGGDMVGGGFDVKKVLPKFVIAVVAVNFTWFGAKVILDVANVATHIVYSIPMSLPNNEKLLEDAIKRQCENVKLTDKKQCYMIAVEVVMRADKSLSSYDDKKGIQTCANAKDPDTQAKCAEIKSRLENDLVYVFDAGIVELYQKKLKSWDELSSGTIPGILAFSILNAQNLGLSYGYEKDLFQVTLKGIVALLMMIIIITVFTAMLFLLLERVIILWINIILSPIGVLLWVLKDTPISVGDSDNKVLGLGAFLKSAFLPALMGIPLIFGLLLIIISKEASLVFADPGGTTRISGIETLIDGLKNEYQLFFYVMALGSMWVAMEIAKKSAQFVGPVVNGISDTVAGAGKFVAKSPIYAQWIPTASTPQNLDGRSSVADLLKPLANLGSLHERIHNKQYQQSRGIADEVAKLRGDSKRIIDNMSPGKAKTHIDALRKMDTKRDIEDYINRQNLNPGKKDGTDQVLRALAYQSGNMDALSSQIRTVAAGSASAGSSSFELKIGAGDLSGKTLSQQAQKVAVVHKADIDAGKNRNCCR
jgi:hypothetical protein